MKGGAADFPQNEVSDTMRDLITRMHDWMTKYIKSFYTDDAEVMQGIRIKEIHTGYVTANAVALAKNLHLSSHDAALAEIIGLFHDVGRFRQYTLYQTFNDAMSEDHAALGLKVLSELPFMKELSPIDIECIHFAISRHNKMSIGRAPSALALTLAKLIRDADKLDIYRVLEPYLSSEGAKKAPKFIKAAASDLVSEKILTCFLEGKQADYHWIKTHGDRKAVRLLWVYDISYAYTLREIMKRGYVDKIISFLPKQEGLDRGIAKLRTYIETKCRSEDIADMVYMV